MEAVSRLHGSTNKAQPGRQTVDPNDSGFADQLVMKNIRECFYLGLNREIERRNTGMSSFSRVVSSATGS
jgi:hypothetical protein